MSSRAGWFVVGGASVAAVGAILLYTHWTPEFVTLYDNGGVRTAVPAGTTISDTAPADDGRSAQVTGPASGPSGKMCRDVNLLATWVPVADTDAACEVVSPPAGVQMPAAKWTSCGNDTGMPQGCQRLDTTDWGDVSDVVAGLDAQGDVEIAYRATCADPERDIVVHASADGVARGAIASRKAQRRVASCDLHPVAVDRGAMFVSALGATDTTSALPPTAASALLRIDGAETPQLVDSTGRGSTKGLAAAGPTRIASWDGQKLVTTGAKGAVATLYTGTADVRELAVADDQVVYTIDGSAGQPAKIFGSRAGAPPTVLATIPANMRAYGIGTDGHAMVYYECEDAREHQPCNLVVGQLSAGGGFTGTRLADKFPLPANHDRGWAVGTDIAAHQVSESAIDFVRLKDGSRGTLRAPAAANGGGFEDVLLIAKNEMFVRTKDGVVRMPTSALPIPLASEGPGTPVGVQLAAEDDDSYWEGGPPWYNDDNQSPIVPIDNDEE